jgi:hypothetical protein
MDVYHRWRRTLFGIWIALGALMLLAVTSYLVTRGWT